MSLRQRCRRLMNAIGIGKRDEFPKLVTLHRFDREGAVFEVAGGVEDFRISQFGGEEEFTARMLEAIGRGEVFFDIGASVGLVSVHAARQGARTFAFEPDPYWRSRLVKNLRLNRLESEVTVVEWAVSDAEGEAELFTDGGAGASPSLRNVGGRDKITVKSDALDRALASGTLPYPDVIKIDIEGAEILALRGMRKLLADPRGPRLIFMEVHPEFLVHFSSSADDVLAYLESFGYRRDYFSSCHDQFLCSFVKPGAAA